MSSRLHLGNVPDTPTTPLPGVSMPSYRHDLELQKSRQAHEYRMRTSKQDHALLLATLANVTTAIKTNEMIAKTNESITVAQFLAYSPRPSENITRLHFGLEQSPSPSTGGFKSSGTPAPTAATAAAMEAMLPIATTPGEAFRTPFAGNNAPTPSALPFRLTPQTPGTRFDFGGAKAPPFNSAAVASAGEFHLGGTPAPATAMLPIATTPAEAFQAAFAGNAQNPSALPFCFIPETPGARFDFGGGGDAKAPQFQFGSTVEFRFGGTPAPTSDASALPLPTASVLAAHTKRRRNDDEGEPTSKRNRI